jgi:hypothetical protein
MTAGVVGGAVGIATAVLLRPFVHLSSRAIALSLGAGLGVIVGAWTGRLIAKWSREKAARLVLEGNRTVLKDIGTQTGRFLQLLQNGASISGREEFFSDLRPGRAEDHGQDRLAKAFEYYLSAVDSSDLKTKQEAMIAGNCEIVYHEHIRLEPYIRGAMPFIIRRCATERMMTYEIGQRALRVGEDIPGPGTSTAAKDWTDIEERMRYVFALFREFHGDPEVFSQP